MIVEPAPVVPDEEDRRARPVGATHDGVDQACYPGLADADERIRVLRVPPVGLHPGDRGQRPRLRRAEKGREALDVPDLTVLSDVGIAGQWVPDARRPDALEARRCTWGSWRRSAGSA